MEMQCDLISWDRFHDLTRRLAFAILDAPYRPDVIVAIARGGYVPARILCDYLDIMDLTSIRLEHYRATRMQPGVKVRYPLSADLDGKRVLLVDDVSDTGETFEAATTHLRERSSPLEVRTAALHHKQVSRFIPDFYVQELSTWRWLIYPWAVMEDLQALTGKLEPPPKGVEATREALERTFGVRVPVEILRDLATLHQG